MPELDRVASLQHAVQSGYTQSCKRGRDLLQMLAIGLFVGQIFGQTLCTIVALCFPRHPLSMSFLAFQVITVLWPARKAPYWAERFLHFAVQSAQDYFPCTVFVEDEEALKPGRPYIVGLEPHSALPSALPAMFNTHSGLMPKGLRDIHPLATSAAFYLPATKHLWWWLGIRSISKASFKELLQKGNSVVLVPGGVSECMIMETGKEVMWLKNRLGFVRLALMYGAPLVPAFVFGQSKTYSWYRPGPPFVSTKVLEYVRKKLGFVPLLMWGRFGTFVPNKVPMHLVFGKPIEVPTIKDPSKQQTQEYLDKYITAMTELYHRHKDANGYSDVKLEVA